MWSASRAASICGAAACWPGHRDAAGFYAAYTNGNVDVTGLVTIAAATGNVLSKTGTVNLDAWSGGAYWTHYGPTNRYLDAVLQGTYYTGNATTQFARLPTTGAGFVGSLEAGYQAPLPVFGPGFVLEPQAQILWQHVSFDQANDGLGAVALGSTSGASGRIGRAGNGRSSTPTPGCGSLTCAPISGRTGARARRRRLTACRCR